MSLYLVAVAAFLVGFVLSSIFNHAGRPRECHGRERIAP